MIGGRGRKTEERKAADFGAIVRDALKLVAKGGARRKRFSN
jgi:hypothetical protein